MLARNLEIHATIVSVVIKIIITERRSCHARRINHISMDDMSVSRESTGRRIGTYGLAIGFFYTVNFSVGIGFLNLPRSFYNAGVLVSCITLAVIAFFNVVTTIWLVETMSRAQVSRCVGCTATDVICQVVFDTWLAA